MTYAVGNLHTQENQTLAEAEREERILLLPVVIYLLLIFIVGLLGNCHVFLVLKSGYKKETTFRIFIFFLACVDIAVMFTVAPFEVVIMLMPFTMNQPVVCKIFRYLNVCLTSSSVHIFLVIAIERYRKIRNPIKSQLQISGAIKLCIVAVVYSCLISLPVTYFQGTRTILLSNNLTAAECSIEDELGSSLYHKMYSGALLLIFIVIILSLICIYTAIMITLSKLKSPSDQPRIRIHSILNGTNSFSENSVEVNDKTEKNEIGEDNSGFCDTDVDKSEDGDSIRIGRVSSSITQQNIAIATQRRKPVTFILVTITFVFILSFLPYTLLEVLDSTISTRNLRHGTTVSVFYHILLRTYLINNIANPFIYCYRDTGFRRELKKLYGWVPLKCLSFKFCQRH